MRERTIVYFNTGAIGEFLMTLHFSDIVHATDPSVRIVIPVRRNAALLTKLTEAYEQVEVIPLGKRELWRGISRLLRLRGVRTVLTQQTFGRTPSALLLLAFLTARGRRLVAFDDGHMLTRALASKRWTFDPDVLFPQEMCRLARMLGYDAPCKQPCLRRRAGAKALGSRDGIVFHLRANVPARTPPVSGWRNVVQAARTKWPELPFVFSGSPSDRAYIDAVIAGIPGCLNVAGQDTLAELADRIAGAALYVGPDTGITHLAAFVGTPSVVWGTRSTPCWWTTYAPQVQWLHGAAGCDCDGKKSASCRIEAEGEQRFRCLMDVSPDMVVDAMLTQLSPSL